MKAANRLFLQDDLVLGAAVVISAEQSTYLVGALRLKIGDTVAVFNGRDGEWHARIASIAKRTTTLEIFALLRPQTAIPDLHYLFAPLKHARLDYMVQKATELGAGRLQPVITARTQVARVNLDRMRANVVEAAEQCGVLTVPDVAKPVPLFQLLADWDEDRILVFADEAAPPGGPLAALSSLKRGVPRAVLIGPEGGFSPEERARLHAAPFVRSISLGPRIMRADTAAVAALALVQAAAGDW